MTAEGEGKAKWPLRSLPRYVSLDVVVWIKNQEQMWEVFLTQDRANFVDVEELEEGRFQFGHVKCEAKMSSKGCCSITHYRSGFGGEVRSWGQISFTVTSQRTVG